VWTERELLTIHVFNVEGVDVAWEVAENRQSDVDEEVGAAACDAVDADGWNCEKVSKPIKVGSTWGSRRTEDCDDDQEDC
jgi:hypothetical protein